MNALLKYLFFLFSIALAFNCAGQSIDSIGGAIQNIPAKYYSKVQKKYSSLDNNLSKKSIKYLKKLQKQENRINRKLSSIDSLSGTVSEVVAKKYQSFINIFKGKKGKLGKVNLNEYNSYIDTLTTSLSFLKKIGSNGKAALPLAKLDELKDKFNQSAKVTEFINDRKQQIQQLLSKYTNLPGSIKKQFDKLRKTAYYYKAQVNEYKSMLKDPKKIEETAIRVLNKIPAFQKFMKENSAIAGLFRIPAGYGTAQSLSGFQTRAQVQQLITNKMGGGPNVGRLFGQQIQAAQGKLDKFKEKLNALKGGSGDIEMPDFKPNNQKTKPFLQRLEYGSNIQTTRGNYFFPTTTDIGLSVGYKLNNKSTVGIGASYKSGWGKDIQHIHITSEGMGLRSYFEYKLKKNFYAAGGFEYNYQQPFQSLQQLRTSSAWQQSGLIGISKVMNVKSKVFKTTKLQLLWDFLSYSQPVRTQAIKFRVGYDF